MAFIIASPPDEEDTRGGGAAAAAAAADFFAATFARLAARAPDSPSPGELAGEISCSLTLAETAGAAAPTSDCFDAASFSCRRSASAAPLPPVVDMSDFAGGGIVGRGGIDSRFGWVCAGGAAALRGGAFDAAGTGAGRGRGG